MGGMVSSILSPVTDLVGGVADSLTAKNPYSAIAGSAARDARLTDVATGLENPDDPNNQFRNAQLQAMQAAQNGLNGQSATQAALNNQMVNNQNAAYAQAASGNQNNAALAQRNAQMANLMGNQQALMNSQPAAINERNSNIQTLAGIGNQGRTGDLNSQQLGLGYESAGLGQATSQAQLNAGVSSANTQGHNQMVGNLFNAAGSGAAMAMASSGGVIGADGSVMNGMPDYLKQMYAKHAILENRLSDLEYKKGKK